MVEFHSIHQKIIWETQTEKFSIRKLLTNEIRKEVKQLEKIFVL